jgi:hypothetical protein
MSQRSRTQPLDPLDEGGRRALASQLGERPEATISLHALYTGEGVAYAIGKRSRFRAALITWTELPDWPHGYGDPRLIVDLLTGQAAWSAVCVASEGAATVASGLAERMGRPSSRLAERFYILDEPPAMHGDSPARKLGPSDLKMLAPTAGRLDITDPRRLLERRLTTGVVVDGRVVAVAHNGASSCRYGDIDVATLKSHRRSGYASACARLVAGWVFESGRRPVWCTNDDNVASKRTADAIGFRQVALRQNVFLQGPPS